MKTKFLFLLMASTITGLSQITIDSTNIVGPGDTRYMAYDYSPSSSISLGSASSTAQNWDFTSLVAEDVDTLNFISPSNALYPPTISGANLSLDFDFDDMSIHLRNDASGLYILEFVGPFGSFPVSDTWANFPMTYGDNFNWSFVIDTIIENTFFTMPGADLARIKKDTVNISEVDAFGTAFTPLGAYDVLRVKNDASSIDSIWTKSLPTSHQVQTVGMTFDPDTLTINVLDTVFFTGLAYHDVTEVDESTYLSNGAISNGGFTYLSDDFHVFSEPGTYYYVCSPHASMGMKGMITVIDDWTLFLTGGDTASYYTFWTDDTNDAGLPLLTLYTDGSGDIYEADFLNDGSGGNTNETWDCISGACIDPGNGTGEYDDLVDCEYQCLSSSIKESNNQALLVYPNPAKDYISFNIYHSGVMKIFGIDGKEVVNRQISPNSTINISDLAEGMYHYQFISNNETQSGIFQVIK